MEHVRWTLGLVNLNQVLNEVHLQLQEQKQEYLMKKTHKPNVLQTSVSSSDIIGFKCIFECGDIRSAKTFNPFTHVYMFDIGYVPKFLLFCFVVVFMIVL